MLFGGALVTWADGNDIGLVFFDIDDFRELREHS